MATDFDQLTGMLAGVEGWLYDGEAWELAKLPRDYPDTSGPLTVVEIGSWKGRSTICLGFGLRNREGAIYAIDPHLPSLTGHAGEYGDVDTFSEFVENVRRAGLENRVFPIRKTSADAARDFANVPIHVLFVDGAHEYQFVIDDIKRYEPLLADFALVAFNDPSRQGVYQALKEIVFTDDSHFGAGRLVQNTVFFIYERFSAHGSSLIRAKARFRRVLAIRALAARYRRFMPMPIVRAGHRISAMLTGTKMEHI